VPKPIIEYSKFNKSGIIAFGSSDGAVSEALVGLGEKNIGLNYCRVKAFPFNDDVRDFINQHETIYVVEQNRDAQLRSLLMLDLDANPKKLIPVLHYDGMPISADFVISRIEEEAARGRAA
jgi:2-oxoglutarate ferredoxin oxidoreductase subunit alpha